MWDRIRRRFGYRRPGKEGDEAVNDLAWRERTSDRELELDRDRPEFRDDFGEGYGKEPEEHPDRERF